MNIIIAEAIGFTNVNGHELLRAKKINKNNQKHQMIMTLFKDPEIEFFYKIGQALNRFIDNDTPLVFVTDWTDPTEMVGLLLEDNEKEIAYPDLGFLAFNTDWDDLSNSGISAIFSHEFSHLWLYFLGFDFALSKANKFHTITSVTDQYMAFSEGFAEHLEIVSTHLTHNENSFEIYDHGLDLNSWISYRDSALRKYAVINNRFIYQTVNPYLTDYPNYADLHLAHITSSAFIPENIKNGSQMMSSEGVVSSFFYYFYMDEYFKNQYCNESFYEAFYLDKKQVNPMTNHYLKVLYTISKIDLKSNFLLIDFVIKYGELYPEETEKLFKLFLDMTNYTTVNVDYKKMFEDLYMIGKLGNPTNFKDQLLMVRAKKEKILKTVLENPSVLKNGLYPNIWVKSDKLIKPVPWGDELVKYYFDINTASSIDLISLKNIDIEKADVLIKKREKINGFNSLEEFKELAKLPTQALIETL